MKVHIKNQAILSMVLANAILLTHSGCINKKTDSAQVKNPPTIIEQPMPDITINENINEQNINTIKKCDNSVFSLKDSKEKFGKPLSTYRKIKVKADPSKDSEVVAKIDELQKLKEVGRINGWSLVKYTKNNKNIEGYVRRKNIKNVGKTYIEVDISDQKLTYYKKGKKFLETDVVTGKDTTPTVEGIFEIYSKNRDYKMIGEHHSYEYFSEYVLKFYDSYYIHDSRRSSFGGDIYHYNGSHGCVNTPYAKVKTIFNKAKVGTEVIVHK